MGPSEIQFSLTQEKLKEIIKAYQTLGEFLDAVVPKEKVYQKEFREGLEAALKEVKSNKTKKIQSFDEFIK